MIAQRFGIANMKFELQEKRDQNPQRKEEPRREGSLMSFDGKAPSANEIRVEEDKLLPIQNTKLRIVVETRVNFTRDAETKMNTNDISKLE